LVLAQVTLVDSMGVIEHWRSVRRKRQQEVGLVLHNSLLICGIDCVILVKVASLMTWHTRAGEACERSTASDHGFSPS
jgi:hypothetical protein